MLVMLSAIGFCADLAIVIWKFYGCALAFPYGRTTFMAKAKMAAIDIGCMLLAGVIIAALVTPTLVGILTPFVGLMSSVLISRVEKTNKGKKKMSAMQWMRS